MSNSSFFGSIKKSYHSLINVLSSNNRDSNPEGTRHQRSNAFNYKSKPICNLFQDEATIIKLIALYRENECLWNPSCSNFKNLKEQEICWKRIAKGVNENLSVSQVKRKINVLRKRWENELAEMREKSLCKQTFESKLFFFNDFKFLYNIAEDEVETDFKMSSLPSEAETVPTKLSEQNTRSDIQAKSSLENVPEIGDGKNSLERKSNTYLLLNPQIKEVQIHNLCNIIKLDLQNMDDELFFEAKWRILDILRETQLKQLHCCSKNIEINCNSSKMSEEEQNTLHLTKSDENQTTL